jgi:iron(III) transport system substrate-binding protein
MKKGFIGRATLAASIALLAALAAVSASMASSSKRPAPPNPLKPILQKVAGLKPAARDAKLHQLAIGEGGTVNLYTSLSKLVYPAVASAWAQAYPDIKLNIYRGASEDVYAKTVAEADAHPSNPGDVIETNGTEMLFMQHRNNVLTPYRGSPYAKAIPSKLLYDTFAADRKDTFLVAWNTSYVSSPPRTFKDLTDPKWKGHIGLEPTDVDWFAALFTYFTTQAKPKMTPAAATAMFKAIAANSQIINGHTELANALASGQVWIVPDSHSQSIVALQEKGAPLEFKPAVNPVLTRGQGMGIAYDTSHPAAALLFYDWMLSPAGQKALGAASAEPANPAFADPHLAGLTILPLDERLVVPHWVQWEKRNAQITGASG